MKCQKVRKMVSQYMDEELSPDDRKSFDLHIDGCPFCSQELEEHMAVHNLFATSERFEMPLGFSTKVLAHLQGTEETWLARSWRLLTARPLFLRTVEVAFALAIVLIGMFSGGLLVPDRRPERQATIEELFSLDLFRATPPGSIGGVYVSLAGGDR
jgi:hypothetical protein